jgi:hypothetical protein
VDGLKAMLRRSGSRAEATQGEPPGGLIMGRAASNQVKNQATAAMTSTHERSDRKRTTRKRVA